MSEIAIGRAPLLRSKILTFSRKFGRAVSLQNDDDGNDDSDKYATTGLFETCPELIESH